MPLKQTIMPKKMLECILFEFFSNYQVSSKILPTSRFVPFEVFMLLMTFWGIIWRDRASPLRSFTVIGRLSGYVQNFVLKLVQIKIWRESSKIVFEDQSGYLVITDEIFQSYFISYYFKKLPKNPISDLNNIGE